MITNEEAIQLIAKAIPKPAIATIKLGDALGYVLAQNIHAPLSLPVMDNSAMDGFVLRASDTLKASPTTPVYLKIRGTLKAGSPGRQKLLAGQAYRIMTGASIIRGTDTVLPKEDAYLQNNSLIVRRPLSRGNHVRPKGEEVKKNDLVIKKGSVIHPGTIAVLASLGLHRIKVIQKPQVAVVATGSELVAPGKPLRPGQIYDSNSWMMASALQLMSLPIVCKKTIGDQPGKIKKAVREVLTKSDMVIFMGGVSVGDYDFVKEILENAGVRKVFWKVDQKPGKPLYFGKKNKTLVFGLPGNPASAYICFYEYIYAALRRMSGFKQVGLSRQRVKARDSVRAPKRKILFLKAKVSTNGKQTEVTPLRHQGSHMVSSLHEANSLMLVTGRQKIKKGQPVLVDLLPGEGGKA